MQEIIKKMKGKSTFIALLIILGVSCRVEWDKMSSLTASYKSNDGDYFFTVPLSFTFDKEKKASQAVDLVPDFTASQTIIASKSDDFSWGIECKGADKNKCNVKANPKIFEGTYQGLTYKYAGIRTLAILPTTADFSDEEVAESAGYQIEMLVSNQSALNYGEVGVLGLSPNSRFFNYVDSYYKLQENQTTVELGLVVFSQKGLTDEAMRQQTNGTFDNSNVFMNGYDDKKLNETVGINTAAILNPLKSSQDQWALAGVSLQVDQQGGMSHTFARTCFAPHFNGTFVISEEQGSSGVYTQLIQAINSQVKGSDFSAVSKLKLSLAVNDGNDTLEILFRPEEFIIEAQNGAAETTINRMSAADIQTQGCGAADLVLGRLFFQRNFVILIRNMQDVRQSKIGISQYLPLDKITGPERNVLLGFGLIMITLILIALVVRCTGGKGSGNGDRDDEYAKV